MDELFAQYERELVTMRQLCREYAERYPKVAAKLQIGGEACDDPHVERLIQSVALLCARVSKRLDDAYPQFTEALLNTRSALLPDLVANYPAVGASVVNYGLIDFAGMCMTSDTDQKRICTAVRQAIERHEPRLHKVAATLQPRKGAINRVDFVIRAELKSTPAAEPMQFNAVFQPSLQRYSIQRVRGAV
jgi:type VI secretion system protein ImpF